MLCFALLFIVLTNASAYPRRSCTDVKPVNLLGQALSEKLRFPTGVEIVTTDGIKGYRFNKQAITFGVDSGVVFGSCPGFPPEFSIQINFKHPAPRNRYEYLLSLLAQDRSTVIFSIRLRKNSVLLEYIREGDRQLESVPFRSRVLGDGGWHNLVISIAGEEVRFTLDCDGATQKLKHRLASNLNMNKTRFYIGTKRRKRRRFTGILRQMVFLPGADASNLICPSAHPSLAALQQENPAASRLAAASLPVIFQKEQPYVTCSVRYEGRLLFADDSTLKVCNDGEFKRVKSSPPRMDYLIDFEDFETPNRTIDLEAFYIPGEGHFIATANSGSTRDSKSAIYQWNGAMFIQKQLISSKEAQNWKHFVIGDEHFLALANGGKGEKNTVKSAIFRWRPGKKKFTRHQLITTHSARSWEAFEIDGMHYLAVANYEDDSRNIYDLCEVFVWNPDERLFTPHQKLPSIGANDVEFFKIQLALGPTYHLLVIANTFNGRNSRVNSTILGWRAGRFEFVQNIETMGAVDWEAFKIDGRQYLAVANSFSLADFGERNFAISSSIYELDYFTRTFVKIQDITTYGAKDWEFFTVGDQYYLIISNLRRVEGPYTRTVVYRWQGVEKFVPIHNFTSRPSADFEHFSIDGEHYLAMADPGAKWVFSKVYKIITY